MQVRELVSYFILLEITEAFNIYETDPMNKVIAEVLDHPSWILPDIDQQDCLHQLLVLLVLVFFLGQKALLLLDYLRHVVHVKFHERNVLLLAGDELFFLRLHIHLSFKVLKAVHRQEAVLNCLTYWAGKFIRREASELLMMLALLRRLL